MKDPFQGCCGQMCMQRNPFTVGGFRSGHICLRRAWRANAHPLLLLHLVHPLQQYEKQCFCKMFTSLLSGYLCQQL